MSAHGCTSCPFCRRCTICGGCEHFKGKTFGPTAPLSESAPLAGKARITASAPVSYDVSPAQVAAYLRANGWSIADPGRVVPGICELAPLWAKGEGRLTLREVPDDVARELEHFAGYGLQILAGVEGRSAGEVLRDIAAMDCGPTDGT